MLAEEPMSLPDWTEMDVQEDKPGLFNDADTAIQSADSDDTESVSSMDASDDSDEEVDPISDNCIFQPEDTLIIFDWDDTILPSTWIQQQGFQLGAVALIRSAEQQEHLSRLARSAGKLLRAAKRRGRVVLVTNAERGWIELSCQAFLPSVYPLLENLRITSARSSYEKPGVNTPAAWKSLAFEREITAFYKDFADGRPRNVISFGDAAYERQAVMEVTQNMPNCSTKSFKFIEQPDIKQLWQEHEMMSRCFRHIIAHQGKLDLQLKFPL